VENPALIASCSEKEFKMAALFQGKISPKYAISWAFITLSAIVLMSCTSNGNGNPTQSFSDYGQQNQHGPGSNR
jgi:hypothetical protein